CHLDTVRLTPRAWPQPDLVQRIGAAANGKSDFIRPIDNQCDERVTVSDGFKLPGSSDGFEKFNGEVFSKRPFAHLIYCGMHHRGCDIFGIFADSLPAT